MFYFIKSYLAGFALLVVTCKAFAQTEPLPHNFAFCDTKMSDTGYYMRNAEAFLANTIASRENNPASPAFSSPYYVRVFIRIVREDDGTLPGCTIAQAVQNFNEMNGQYSAHNICFQLAGIDFVDDSYLNNFNNSANIDAVYPTYIRNNNLDVDGAVTIFVHYNYLFNSGSSGNAYGIPNNFLSTARWAVTSNSVHSIFGHEMGHCLGLYHTFQKQNSIQESVTRNSGNACYNCDTGGDLCCDTPADYTNSQDYTDGTTCDYVRNFANACDGLQYNPSVINIMSYQPWSCISFTSTAITTNQRTRMHATILNPFGPIYTRVAEDNVLLGSVTATSNLVRLYTAKNNITTAPAATVSHSSSSKAYYAAGNSITFSPGISFAPGSAGVVNASISGCN
jgi:hypothetical protein